ncbi:MAG: hypothetical protein L6305_06090 [Actinomycetia bacterium]|nr:hypothetical protein [Actinomycetes bacterium]
MNIQTFPTRIVPKDTWIFVAGLSIAVLYALLPLSCSLPFFIIFFGLLLGAVIILVDSPTEFNKIFFLFAAGFFIRILVTLFLYSTLNILQINDGFLIGDGQSYSLNGWKISRLWNLGIMVNKANFTSGFGSLSGTVGNYDFFNAIIYYFSGYNPIILFFINCLASSLLIVFIYIIANKIFSNEIAWLASAFCAFFPSFILWSSQNLKDPLTNLCIVSFLYFLIKLRYELKVSSIIFLFLSVISLCYLRMLIIAPLAVISIASFFLCYKVRIEIKIVFIILALLLALSLFKHVFSYHFISGLLEDIDTTRRGMAYGNLAYFQNFKISSIGTLLLYIPLGFFAVWFSPFPWQIGSISQIFVLPEMLLWYIFIPFLCRGIYISLKDKKASSYIILITLLVFSIFLGVYESNLGTLYRHKAVIIMLAYIFISAGLLAKQKMKAI